MHRSRVGMDAQKPGLAREMHKAKFRAHHEKRLEEISRRAPGTGTVDNTPPYTAHLVHLKTRPKKKAILAARDAEVERANRDLLRQMTKIFTTPSALLPIVDSVGNRGNGRGPCVSINVLCRKRELERIALENKTWVKHLNAVTPSYDVASWERDRTANKKVMERLRTVRYVREKSTPEEFSRRGVRHLRKQVARTRGQALEAGFSPVPRLFDSTGKRRKAGYGKKRGRRPSHRKLSTSSSFSSPPSRCQELIRTQSQGAASDSQQQRQRQQVEDDGTDDIPIGCTVSVRVSKSGANDGGGKGSVRNMEASAEEAAAAAAAEIKEAGDDDGSQSAYSEFEDEGEVEEEGDEEQEYSEFEDEPEEDDEDQYSEFGEGESNGEAETQHTQQHGTSNGEATTVEKPSDRSEGTAESEQTGALASSGDDGVTMKGMNEVAETSQSEAEAPGEEQGRGGGGKVETEIGTGQDDSSNIDVGGAGGSIGTASGSAEQDDEQLNQDVATSGKEVDDGGIVQPATLQRESAGGLEVTQESGGGGRVGVEACADEVGSSGVDTDHNIGIKTRKATEANETEQSGNGQPQPNKNEESPRDGTGVGQPQPLHRELRDGDADERDDSGRGQPEERGESAESGCRSESFEGDGDTSESAMSGPAPEMTPTEEAATGISPDGGGEPMEAAAVATDPAPPSPTATPSGEAQPTSSDVEGGNSDGSSSTPPLVDSPLPLEDQPKSPGDPVSSSAGPHPLEESPSSPLANHDSSPPPLPQLESGLPDDAGGPAAAVQQVSRHPVGDYEHEPLQEAGIDAVRAAAGEGTNAQQPELAGKLTLARRPSSPSLAPADGEGACTRDGVEGTIIAVENEATTNSAANSAGKPATDTNSAAAALTTSETGALIEPPSEVGDPASDDTQVEKPRQSSEEPLEFGGGPSSLSVEVAPPENVSTGPSLPSTGMEGTEETAPASADEYEEPPTKAVLSVVGGGDGQSCADGEDKDEGAGLPSLDQAEDQPLSTPALQPDRVVQKDGGSKSSRVRRDGPEAPVVPSKEESGGISAQEAESGAEVTSSADVVRETASETTNGDHLELQPQVAANAEQDSTKRPLEGTEQNGGDGDRDETSSEPPEPSPVLAKESDVEGGDLESAPAEDDLAEHSTAVTGETSVPEESAKNVTPTTEAGTTADLVVAGGTPLEPQPAEEVARDPAIAENAEPGEVVGETTLALDRIDANLEEGGGDPTSIPPATDGTSSAEPGPPLPSLSGDNSPPPGPVSTGGSLDAPPEPEALESGGGYLSDAGTDPAVVVDAAQGENPGVDDILSSISVDAGLHSPSPHTEEAEAAASPQDMLPSGTDVGDGSGGPGPTAAEAATLEPEGRAAEEATTATTLVTDAQEKSPSQNSISAGGQVASTTGGEEAPPVCASETIERVAVQGEEGREKLHRVEAGTGAVKVVASSENTAAVQEEGDRAVQEEDLVREEAEQGTETHPASANNSDGGEESKISCELFDDLSSSAGEAAEGEEAKSEDDGNSTSIEGPDTPVSSLGGKVLGGEDGRGSGKCAAGTEAGALVGELLPTASFDGSTLALCDDLNQ